MKDPYDMVARPGRADGDLPERIWTYDDFTSVDELSGPELATGFIDGAFIKAALGRRKWLWCAAALVGLLIGCGLYVKFPPAYHATTTVLLTNPPNQDPATVMQTDAALATSIPVAERAVQQLGLRQSVDSLIAASTVTVTTEQVLTINVGAPSAADAVARANALTAAFLQFRAAYLETQQQQLATELNQQLNQAQQNVKLVNQQISHVSAQPSSATQQATLRRLNKQSVDASNALYEVQQYATDTLESSKTTTDTMVRESRLLNPAILDPRSKKTVLLEIAGGLVGGLGLGMGIVVIGAVVSDRLRRRDEVAEALGAPVRLSVGELHVRRWLPPLPWRAAKRNLDMSRIVAHLRNAVPGSSRGPASLAVVAIDDVIVAAQAVASLAVSYANEGKQVVAADLSGTARLARLLRAKGPGIHAVSREGVRFAVTIPERDDVAPIGPLHALGSPAVLARTDEALVGACRSADLLLTLATLDPALGSDYLATWATDAVAVVTAGESSQERIRGVGEMIRSAGTRLNSVVLVGADKNDRSLGAGLMPDQSMSFGPF